jgi:hypothetical protein
LFRLHIVASSDRVTSFFWLHIAFLCSDFLHQTVQVQSRFKKHANKKLADLRNKNACKVAGQVRIGAYSRNFD